MRALKITIFCEIKNWELKAFVAGFSTTFSQGRDPWLKPRSAMSKERQLASSGRLSCSSRLHLMAIANPASRKKRIPIFCQNRTCELRCIAHSSIAAQLRSYAERQFAKRRELRGEGSPRGLGFKQLRCMAPPLQRAFQECTTVVGPA